MSRSAFFAVIIQGSVSPSGHLQLVKRPLSKTYESSPVFWMTSPFIRKRVPLPSREPSNTTPFTVSIWNWRTCAQHVLALDHHHVPARETLAVMALKPTQSADSTRSGCVMRTLPRAT
jgi:hypothetical protein